MVRGHSRQTYQLGHWADLGCRCRRKAVLRRLVSRRGAAGCIALVCACSHRVRLTILTHRHSRGSSISIGQMDRPVLTLVMMMMCDLKMLLLYRL